MSFMSVPSSELTRQLDTLQLLNDIYNGSHREQLALDKLQRFVVKTGAVHDTFNQITDDGWEDISEAGIITPAQPIEPNTCRQAIDPNQPTFGMRSHVFPGATFLAVAADLLRADGEPICNVALLPPTIIGSEHYSRRGYYANYGAVVHKKRLYRGDFPSEVRIDGTHTAYNEAMATHKQMRPLNDPATEALMHDKRLTHQRFQETKVPHIAPLIASIAKSNPNLPHVIQGIYEYGDAFVIKEPLSDQGEGVLMVDQVRQSLPEVMKSIDERYTERANIVVEPWVQSYPLYANDGERLDWNIRALVYGGVYAGSYARLGEYGKPVNISHNAVPCSLDVIFSQCNVNEAQQATLHAKLDLLYKQAAQALGAGCIGFDVIIDQSLTPRIIEANGEASGGLQNIILTSGGTQLDFDPAITAIRSINRSLFGGRQPRRHIFLSDKRVSASTRHDETVHALYSATITKHPKRLQKALKLSKKALAEVDPAYQLHHQLNQFISYGEWKP